MLTAQPLLRSRLPDWSHAIDLSEARFSLQFHGDYQRWADAINAFAWPSDVELHIDQHVHLRAGQWNHEALAGVLHALHPWRKGPWSVCDTFIDTEWRSDWKWQRLQPHLPALEGARVLDVGCGNGWFGWQLLRAGAQSVIGVDPTLLFCMQHAFFHRALPAAENWVLPLRFEEVPDTALFDLVLSMGVVYHRKDPQDHVNKLANVCHAGGSVVLETLVVEDGSDLLPASRYARMGNVWVVPALSTAERWLRSAGLRNVRCLDVSRTTTDEQRTTSWMRFESLQEALDPADPFRTVEGHPAPVRAMFIAQKS